MSGWQDADLDRLSVLQHQLETTDAAIRAQVATLRQHECPWSLIGNHLGITRQAAQQRFGSIRVSLLDRELPSP